MGGKNILVIADTFFMRMVLGEILVKNGFTVCGEGQDGFEAIKKYREFKPDLLIMDIVMRNMDGITALRKIKNEFPQAKIIMSTGIGQETYAVNAMESGADGLIMQPFQSDRIISTVAKVLK